MGLVSWAQETLKNLGINPEYAAALYADMQRRDTGFALFSEIARQFLKDKVALTAAFQRGPQVFSRYLLTQRTGLAIEGFQDGNYRPKALGDLYETALALKVGGLPLTISGTIAHDRDLTKIRELVASVGRLHGIFGGVDAEVLTHTGDVPITDNNIDDVIKNIDNRFLEKFKEVFKLGNRPVTMDDIRALEAKWGNLEVFYTLVARFNGRSDWRPEVAVLGQVVRAVLDGRFEELKFEGDATDSADQAKARAQTAMLRTPEHREGWRKNFSRIGVSNGTNTGPTLEENLNRSQDILRSQVMGHVVEHAGRHERAYRSVIHATIREVKNEFQQKGFKTEVLKNLRRTHHHYNEGALLVAVLELAQETQNLSDYLNVLKFIRGNDGLFGLDQQLKDDLKTLDATARAVVKGEEAIVFTTTTADSKLLLMTGDLVGTSSCQNYKTGSHIQTLLGYVMDAGVKLMLTYTITRRNFQSQQDFDRAKQLIAEGASIEFIAARRALKIGDMEIILPRAVNRHVIKLGATDEDKAGIAVERAYAQAHTAEELMREQIAQVLKAQSEASGAVTGEKITIPPSRNPGGVYSDANGGVHTDAYSIVP